jgi:methylenetetrahydrofolate dehydrogenase (NADP+)/methenyltetrahydrofolate cyclohydrolase
MTVLDGKIIAREIKASVKESAEQYRQQGIVPTLAIVLATGNGGAVWYVNSIRKAAEACAIDVRMIELAHTATTDEIADALRELANDDAVHGIILQTPLPQNCAVDDLLGLIPLHKDVDGANPLSAGNLLYGIPGFAPATAAAVMKVIDYYDINLSGKQVIVIGRSRVVGKPVANLLLNRDATVTICHSRTPDIANYTTVADVLVVAAGKPGLVTAEMINPGSIVIDVGTNPTPDGKLVGDVDPRAEEVAGAITPVPGGIGAVTTALILQHTLVSVTQNAP